MRRALRAAEKGVGHTAPEPAVGVLAVLGEATKTAYRDDPGDEHPALAFADADALYLTIEPPPRIARQLDAKRIVIGADDPRWRGRARRALAKKAEVHGGVLADAIEAADPGFFFAARHGRPHVVLKSAMTLDGRIATRTGESQWITGEAARAYGHRLRDRADAIVVGMGTVRADDPLLTSRVPRGRNPVRVVLDATLSIPLDAQLVRTARDVPTIVVGATKAANAREQALADAGVQVLRLPARRGRIAIAPLLESLFGRGINQVLVEGGAEVAGAFVDAGLVDEVRLFVAPMLFGGAAKNAIAGEGVARLADALRLERMHVTRLGEDLLLTAYAVRDARADVHGDRRGRGRDSPNRGRTGRR